MYLNITPKLFNVFLDSYTLYEVRLLKNFVVGFHLHNLPGQKKRSFLSLKPVSKSAGMVEVEAWPSRNSSLSHSPLLPDLWSYAGRRKSFEDTVMPKGAPTSQRCLFVPLNYPLEQMVAWLLGSNKNSLQFCL